MQLRSLVLPTMLLLGVAAAATSAEAQNLDAGRAMLRPVGSTDKEAGIGVGVGPTYLGGGKQRWMAGIDVQNNWSNGVFLSTTDGLGYRFLETPSGFSMAASIGTSMGRAERDGKGDGRNRLRGMGDVNVKAQANLFLNYDSGAFHVNAGVHQTLASRRGTSADLAVAYDLMADKDDLLRADIGIAYANRNLMQTFFGVTAQQAASSGNPVYTARAGVAGSSASLTWRHAFSPNWIGSLGAGVIRLQGAAGDSPLTEKRTSPVGGMTIMYRF